MDFINADQPMEALTEWQDWYRKNQAATKMDTLLTNKNMHKTIQSINSINKEAMKKAQEHFEDTISEFFDELSAKDLYDAFYKAVNQQVKYFEEEYEKSKELMNLLTPQI